MPLDIYNNQHEPLIAEAIHDCSLEDFSQLSYDIQNSNVGEERLAELVKDLTEEEINNLPENIRNLSAVRERQKTIIDQEVLGGAARGVAMGIQASVDKLVEDKQDLKEKRKDAGKQYKERIDEQKETERLGKEYARRMRTYDALNNIDPELAKEYGASVKEQDRLRNEQSSSSFSVNSNFTKLELIIAELSKKMRKLSLKLML